ncbi:DNA-directed RNA polymerase subunit beta [Lactobacillus sp. CC-MHH1034]|nr:DNA-directed RNA polymerase subunit beta [Agrilactobacillus fermenti]
MKKWQGWFLSDHSAALEADALQAEGLLVRPEQSETEVGTILEISLSEGLAVTIQLNILEGDRLLPDIKGYVRGYDEANHVVLATAADHQQKIRLTDIRNVILVDQDKWYREGIDDYGIQSDQSVSK